jgi:hypothetical protein
MDHQITQRRMVQHRRAVEVYFSTKFQKIKKSILIYFSENLFNMNKACAKKGMFENKNKKIEFAKKMHNTCIK